MRVAGGPSWVPTATTPKYTFLHQNRTREPGEFFAQSADILPVTGLGRLRGRSEVNTMHVVGDFSVLPPLAGLQLLSMAVASGDGTS